MDFKRRKFLKQSALVASGGIIAGQLPPVNAFLKLLQKDLLRKAYAQNPLSKINYLSFHFMGAPARWCFDQFLKTDSQQAIVNNHSVATQLTGDGQSYSGADYVTFDYKGFPTPTLWKTPVKTANGGQRPLVDLLPHLLAFRGYGTGVDGHNSNSARQTNPVPSAGSLTGHVADQSNCLFRALQFPQLGSWSGYHSIQSTGLTLVSAKGAINYAAELLSPFIQRGDSAPLSSLQQKYKSAVSEAFAQIRHIASKKFDGLGPLDLDFQNSLKALQNGVSDLESSWSQLYQKYETLIISNLKDRSVVGLSDLPVVGANNSTFDTIVNGNTLRPTVGTDLRDWMNTVDCTILISTFALAEFAIRRGYATALEFGELHMMNLQGYFGDNPEPITFGLNFDQHTMGVVPMTFLNAMYFRAFGAALLELIDQLKKSGQFENTFIHLVQEFGRTPRSDGSGSDHGFDAMMSTVFTGLNNDRPIVVGNIVRDTSNPNYPGTYGEKALTRVGADYTSLTPAHVASTLANLMRLEVNPWANVAEPLIIRNGNSLTTLASGDIV